MNKISHNLFSLNIHDLDTLGYITKIVLKISDCRRTYEAFELMINNHVSSIAIINDIGKVTNICTISDFSKLIYRENNLNINIIDFISHIKPS